MIARVGYGPCFGLPVSCILRDMQTEAVRRAAELKRLTLLADHDSFADYFYSWHKTTTMHFWDALRICEHRVKVGLLLPWDENG